jgi:predicted nucleic acid-binding protein
LILVDTSVWVDHLRRGEPKLVALLDSARVGTHPFIIGEIACGNLANRPVVVALLKDLPRATVADNDEVLTYIERHRLHGTGIGYVDAHLLASVALSGGTSLWTRDKRLHKAAMTLRCAYLDAESH